jgi:spermidine/putrescine transport system permease protein
VIAFPLKGFTTNGSARCGPNATCAALEFADHRGLALGLCDLSGDLRRPRLDPLQLSGKGPIMGLIMLPLVLPEIIVAMALLVVLLSLGVPLSIFTVIMGHTLICMPLRGGDPVLRLQVARPSLEEAAYDLGETKWSAFRLIILPLVMPGIISSC